MTPRRVPAQDRRSPRPERTSALVSHGPPAEGVRAPTIDWPARTITPCADAPFGSYRNHIALPVPPGLDIGGETGAVGLDYCIAHEVYGLWQQGIRTRASCCGHGRMPGFIAVDERDEGRMAALGYEGERNAFGVMCWGTKTGCAP